MPGDSGNNWRRPPEYCAGLLLLLAALPVAAQGIDRLRLEPRTGIYVETDYLAPAPRPCDWYYPAERLLDAEIPAAATPCPVVVRLRGTLNRDGALLFDRVADRLRDWPAVPTRIVLNSAGGDAVAAFHIARRIRGDALFRKAPGGVTTAIDEANNAVCFSACLIVFAAGYRRHARFDEYDDPSLPSRLGIHRPGQFDPELGEYASDPGNRDIRIARRQLEHYFESVNVDKALVDAMYAVPFDDIHLLTETEARDFGLVPAR